MHAYSKWATMVLLAAGLATGSAASYAADSHTDSGHSSGKKGPKYMGGSDRSHSSAAHKGGSSHHDSAEGGSKSLEDKIFHGKSGGSEGHEEGGTETEHTH
jgi:hypothetical protein